VGLDGEDLGWGVDAVASAGWKDGDEVLYLRRADERAKVNLVGEMWEMDCIVSEVVGGKWVDGMLMKWKTGLWFLCDEVDDWGECNGKQAYGCKVTNS
jgi:hypothetical protein